MKNLFRKFGLLLALMAAIMFVTGCTPSTGGDNQGNGGSNIQPALSTFTVTIYVFEDSGVKPLTFEVDAGESLKTITGLADPALEGYEFLGFYTKKGTKFDKTVPIQTNLELYAKFSKVINTATEGSTTTITSEIKTADETTGDKTETITTHSDGSKTSVVTVTTIDDKTEQTVSSESTTTTTQQDGTSTSTTEITVYDDKGEEVSTVTTTSTVTTDEDGNKTENTTTTETNVDGSSSTTTTTTVTDEEGEAQTTSSTTETDAEGNTTVVVNPNTTVHQLIENGIACLVSNKIPDIGSAQAYFNRAYELDKNDNEAKVYSALADLTAIATNSKIQKFFKDHLGITNYPSTVNALISGQWAREGEYKTEYNDSFRGGKLTKVNNPESDKYYWYRVKIDDDPKNYYYDSDLENEEDDSFINVYAQAYDYEILQVAGSDYLVDRGEKWEVEDKLAGQSEYFNIMGMPLSPYGWGSSSWSVSGYVIPDDEGSYWTELYGDYSDLATPYLVDFKFWDYTYPFTMYAPVFKDFGEEDGEYAQDWFIAQAKTPAYFYYLVLANVLHGNVTGFDAIIDDLYGVLFDSDEYKSACAKIAAINGAVVLPDEVIAGFGLQEMFGDAPVAVGATELKLIKSALDVFKGIFEYLQCYSFSTDLSFLEDGWENYYKLLYNSKDYADEAYSAAAIEYFFGLISEYNEEIDPIANGFLSVRNANKLAASKATFEGVIDDVIASYDSIIKEGAYPAAISDNVKKVEVLRDAAVELKKAIKNGGKFYIPMNFDDGLPAAWPLAASDSVYTLDCGKLFTPGQFAIENLIGLYTEEEFEADVELQGPAFYYPNDKDKMTALTGDDFGAMLDSYMEEEDEDEPAEPGEPDTYYGEDDYETEMPYVYMKIPAFNSLYEVLNIPEITAMPTYVKVPLPAALLIYNFYNGGFEEFVEFMAAEGFSEKKESEPEELSDPIAIPNSNKPTADSSDGGSNSSIDGGN